jgi:hypothetical protein
MSGGFPACAVATGRWRAGLAAPAIAAPLIAASALAPSGATATIQADPVCLPVTAQPGHSYALSVYVSGNGPLTLAVTPAHGPLERSLHQVPASWVRFAANPASPGTAGFTLAVPSDAEPGAYWSDVTVTAQPGAGGQAALGAAATTAIVLSVGPSSVPPPPCGALDVAQSTGQFPSWPTEAFKTSSWKQVFASQEASERAAQTAPTAIPTAGTWPSAAPAAPAYSSVANAGPAAGKVPKVPSSWPGYLVIGGVILLVLAGLRRWLRS